MKSLFLTALVLSLGLVGCAFSKDPGQNKDKNESAETVEAKVKALAYTGELSEQNVRFEFLDLDTPGYYKLLINWPKEVPSMKVSINNSPYTIVSGTNKFEVSVEHSVEIALHIISLNSLGGETSSLSAQLSSPKDLIISSAKEIHQDTLISVNRFYLNEKGRIVTNGHVLTVVTNKLFIENKNFDNDSRMHTRDAQIITTPPGRTIPSLAFLSGSKIKIEANKAYGHLRIAMVGFDGINGVDGSTGEPGQPGKNGNAANIEYIQDMCVGGDGMPCRSSKDTSICRRNPTAGTAGSNGSQGGDGQDGSRGGSPGILSVMVQDSSEFSLEVAQRKGKPGLGGKGGLGGLGGAGGKAGDSSRPCTGASAGPNGAAGEKGQDGANGPEALLNHIDTNVKTFRSYEIE